MELLLPNIYPLLTKNDEHFKCFCMKWNTCQKDEGVAVRMKITSFSKERCYFLCSDVIQLLWSLDRLTPDKYDDYQKASSNCACFEVTSNFQHKLPTICAVNCFPYVNVAMTKCNQNVDTNEHGFSRLMFTYFIFAQWFRKPYFWLVKILQQPDWYTILVNKIVNTKKIYIIIVHPNYKFWLLDRKSMKFW